MRIALQFFLSFLAYVALSIGTLLLLSMIIDYASFRTDIHFLQYKQAYIHNPLWMGAFYTHIFTGILALMAGFTQFSDFFLKNHRDWHRRIGRLYAYDILLINFPAGMILAVNANGLWPSRLAFILLDCLWWWFTWKAVAYARQRRFREHRQYMIRSYALTCSAIGLRSWKIILSHCFHPDPLRLYMIDAWMGFAPNLLFAELLIRRQARKATNRFLPLKPKGIKENEIDTQVEDHKCTEKTNGSEKAGIFAALLLDPSVNESGE